METRRVATPVPVFRNAPRARTARPPAPGRLFRLLSLWATFATVLLGPQSLLASGSGPAGLLLFQEYTVSRAFVIVALLAIGVLSFLLFLALFEPALDYRVSRLTDFGPDGENFLRVLAAATDSTIHHRTTAEVLTNGDVYYEAELEAIRRARNHVNIEAYIFKKGRLALRFVEVLTERARAGVRVHLLMDAAGSFRTWNSYFREFEAAGGRFAWYHPMRWYTITRYNNRTHRELIVVDGRVGFVGGSGFADHWIYKVGSNSPWRDTMVRVEGDAVAGLQATFLENWLEATGEVLAGANYFPPPEAKQANAPAAALDAALVVGSTPSAGASTRSRILFQMLIANARRSIMITTPYFLPDRSARQELIRAVQERGVDVKIITPGKKTDLRLIRRASRRIYGELLLAGIQIYEYQPVMIHTKSLVIDGTWAVAGSTNFDHRSFGLNDEVNLVVRDEQFSARLAEDFRRDLASCRRITYHEWRHRALPERLHELFGRLLERQH